MKTYELTFIIDTQLSPEKQEEEIAKFLDLLKSLGAEILNVEKWGKKKLAYAIEDRQYGYYLMSQFKAQTNVIAEIEHYLRLSPHVLRYLTLHRDARTLKLMELESERLAHEAMYAAEKEHLPAHEVGEKETVHLEEASPEEEGEESGYPKDDEVGPAGKE